MDAAEKHENRYRAVIEYANGAMFNVAELDAWAASNSVPISFQKLLEDESLKHSYDATRHYVSFEILSINIAWGVVPKDTDPDDARVRLIAAHDDAEPANPVSRLRDLVMMRYDRLLLSAVYDGMLNLYDTLTMSRTDVSAARIRYEAEPEAYLQAAHARLIDTAQGMVTPADIEQAKNTLSKKFARLDHLAWAMVILTADAPPPGEDRYRQILSTTRWLQALSLPFRHSNGLPASQPKGVPVTGMDVREYQYLAVADVRTAAIEAGCWPIEKPESPAVQPFSCRVYHPVKLLNLPLLAPDLLAREIAFAMVEIPDDWLIEAGQKWVPTGNGSERIEPLDTADFQLIRNICGSNPPLRGTEADFKQFEARFNEAESKQSWDLCLKYRPSDAQIKARNEHNDIYSAHREKMAKLGKRSVNPPLCV